MYGTISSQKQRNKKYPLEANHCLKHIDFIYSTGAVINKNYLSSEGGQPMGQV